jgi:hypothetical protein
MIAVILIALAIGASCFGWGIFVARLNVIRMDGYEPEEDLPSLFLGIALGPVLTLVWFLSLLFLAGVL